MSMLSTLDHLDFGIIEGEDVQQVRAAILRGDNFQGYIPSEALAFIVRNFRLLAHLKALEAAWADSYVHSSNLSAYGVDTIQAVFDACDRKRLREIKPLPQMPGKKVTLFRGCAGPVHTMGMSWTPSLDKAIWYAAKHAAHYDLSDLGVYVSTVSVDEVYCFLDYYDADYIVRPADAWRIEVPETEYRLDRYR